jgi:hypothetical protein
MPFAVTLSGATLRCRGPGLMRGIPGPRLCSELLDEQSQVVGCVASPTDGQYTASPKPALSRPRAALVWGVRTAVWAEMCEIGDTKFLRKRLL